MAHQRGISADIAELGTKSMTDRITVVNRLSMKFTVSEKSNGTINGELIGVKGHFELEQIEKGSNL